MAGAGTGMIPCCERAKPVPIGSGDDQQFADAQFLERPRGTDDIHNRIDRADFMKVHVLGRGVMHFRLGVCEHFENRARATLRRGADR